MIRSFKDPEAEALFAGRVSRRLQRAREWQYRICFVWRDGDAHDVEVVDYH